MPLTPVLTKRFGTDQPWKIDNYEALDGYAGLRKALAMAPDEIIAMVKDSNLRGRGGAGFPTGMKWQFIPQPKEGETQAALRRDQRRRGRARHLPRPADHDERPALDDRGHHHRLLRGPRHARRSSTSAARPCTRSAGSPARCARPTQGLPRQEHPRQRRRRRHRRARRRRRLHLRRRDGAARLARGQARPAAAQAAVPGDQRPLRRADRRQQRRHAGHPPVHHLGGADWFKALGPRRARPARRIYSLSGRVNNPGQYEAPMGTTLRELLEMAGGMREGHAEVLDAGRLVHADVHRRAPRCPARLRLGRQGRLDQRHLGRDDLRRLRLRRAGHAEVDPSSTSTSRAASARRAARATTGWRRSSSGSRTGTAPTEDLDTLLDTCRQHPRPVVLRAR